MEEHLRIGRKCGVNGHLNVPWLVAGMIGGAGGIGDMGPLRPRGDGCAVGRAAGAVRAGVRLLRSVTGGGVAGGGEDRPPGLGPA